MIIETTVQGLQHILAQHKQENRSIGFTPTMGALHMGHISLLITSKKECDVTICCIFVNPTQFNEQADLVNYPKTYNEDVEKLVSAGVDILFFPSVKEVYPVGENTDVNVDFGVLETSMEGEFRPDHFKGMAQVVKRLLDITKPAKLYMGQKDFQQAAIVKFMIETLDIPVELCICPIFREEHGLAMSSRNLRLKKIDRRRAGQLYKSLCYLQAAYDEGKEMKQATTYSNRLLALPGFKLEYLEVVDGRTLESIGNWKNSDYIVACLACWVGDVRLIDNKIIKNGFI